MRSLPYTIPLLILLMALKLADDSPHGEDFTISCSVCHSPKGWELDREIYSFDHNSTELPLEGQHTTVNCRLCHPTLVFTDAGTQCAGCHTDMHYQTVGLDCGRCHTAESWLVSDISGIHRQGRFPLVGAHLLAECQACHPSASLLRFEPLSIECIDCHLEDYTAAANPNHILGNFSTDCIECHSMDAFAWSGSGFIHFFFPLTEGHAIYDCNRCHNGTDYADISSECFSCHQSDFNSATNPNHLAGGIPTDCMECHTTLPGWKPANFTMHDDIFPLTDGHAIIECNRCHDVNDYSNVSADCFSCHQDDYNATTNPGHVVAEIPTDCIECHTTLPGWKPASFAMHDAIFPLTDGHAINECNRCHDPNDYSNVSADCFSCHQDDYNATTNPGHVAAELSTDCAECHTTQPGWKPADFTVHDTQFFPIYSGGHLGQWDNCTDCHTNTSNYAVFTCIDCHAHNKTAMDDKHLGEVSGYEYNSPACLDCHPAGSKVED